MCLLVPLEDGEDVLFKSVFSLLYVFFTLKLGVEKEILLLL